MEAFLNKIAPYAIFILVYTIAYRFIHGIDENYENEDTIRKWLDERYKDDKKDETNKN